jgi:hypothetical protein
LQSTARDFELDTALAEQYSSLVMRMIDAVELEEDSARSRQVISITEGGVSGAHTRKIRNIAISRNKLYELCAHGLVTTAHGIGHPHPLLLAAGVALLGYCAWQAAEIRIPEQEASVFWGLIQAHVLDPSASCIPEPRIMEVANQEREKDRNGIRLGAPLPAEAIRRSLEFLERIHSVALEQGQPPRWRIVESHSIEQGVKRVASPNPQRTE